GGVRVPSCGVKRAFTRAAKTRQQCVALSAPVVRFDCGDPGIEHGRFAPIVSSEPSIALAWPHAIVARRAEQSFGNDARLAWHDRAVRCEAALRLALAAAHPLAARERTEAIELQRAANEALFCKAALWLLRRRCGCVSCRGCGGSVCDHGGNDSL